MTYDPNQPGTPEPEEPSPVGDAMADAKAAFNKAGFSTPIGMVGLAALIILAVEVIFGVIMREYSTGPFLVPAVVATVIYFGKGAYDRIAPADALLKLLGMVFAGIAVISLLHTLRNAGSALNNFPDILGYLLTYGAALLAFLGARGIK